MRDLPSNEVANGDRMEDRDLEDERDDDDAIVQDHGFAARSSWAVQTGYEVEKPSDEFANGDRDDDRELEDERDPEDAIVQDNGFAARSSWVQLKDDVGKKEIPTEAHTYSD